MSLQRRQPRSRLGQYINLATGTGRLIRQVAANIAAKEFKKYMSGSSNKSNGSKRKVFVIAKKTVARGNYKVLKTGKKKRNKRRMTMQSRIKRLESIQSHNWNENMGRLLIRTQIGVRLSCNVNQKVHKEETVLDRPEILSLMQDVKDVESAGSTDVNMANTDASSNVYVREVKVFKFRNNGAIPVNLRSTTVSYLDDDGSTYLGEVETTAGELGISNMATTTQYFHDNYRIQDQLKNKYKIIDKVPFTRLNAGDEIVYKLDSGWKKCNEAQLTVRSETNWSGYTKAMIFDMMGVVCHDDTTTALIGYGDGSVDYVIEAYKYVKAPGTKARIRLENTSALPAITTAVVDGPNVEEIKEQL